MQIAHINLKEYSMKCKDCRFFKKLNIQGNITYCCCKGIMDPDGVIVQMNKPEGCPDIDTSNDDITAY